MAQLFETLCMMLAFKESHSLGECIINCVSELTAV